MNSFNRISSKLILLCACCAYCGIATAQDSGKSALEKAMNVPGAKVTLPVKVAKEPFDKEFVCRFAFKTDPGFASNIDPP